MKIIKKLLSALLVLLLITGCGSSKSSLSSAIDKEVSSYKQQMNEYLKDNLDSLTEGLSNEQLSVIKKLIDIAVDFEYSIVKEEKDGEYAIVHIVIKTYDLEKLMETVEDKLDSLGIDDDDDKAISVVNSCIDSFKKQGKTKTYETEIEFTLEDGKLVPVDDIMESFAEALYDNISELF